MKNLTMTIALFCAALLTDPSSAAAEPDADRGEYLVSILGCGGCHTEGAIVGRRGGAWLAGSNIGIAYTDTQDGSPGVVFAGNLTPDDETGLGRWTTEDIARAIRRGVNHAGQPVSTVMPWANYSLLKREDATDIAAYLKSLAPVSKETPENVPEGAEQDASYVRIGVYVFDGAGHLSEIAPLPAK